MKIEPGMWFGRWVVLSLTPKGKGEPIRFTCRCDCGETSSVRKVNLVNGSSRSCGCLQAEQIATRNRTHGLKDTPEYRSWAAMKNRCHSEKAHNYSNYGDRGITVCERWRGSFEAFYADMGPRPSPQHSLDRINNDGNYEPENCRWTDRFRQAGNRRSVIPLEYKGELKSAAEWGRIFGLRKGTIYQRLGAGWSVEKTLTTPSSAYQARGRGKDAQSAT